MTTEDHAILKKINDKSIPYVIVMNNGAVEAEGTPEELLKTNEYYRTFAGTDDEEEIFCTR